MADDFQNRFLNFGGIQKNIFEVLDMTMKEASEFFEFDYVLKNTFELMTETGLGYLKLGQTSPSLSGGEAQRLKLGAELSKVIDKKSIPKDLPQKITYTSWKSPPLVFIMLIG